MFRLSAVLVLCVPLVTSLSNPLAPTVKLDRATVTGKSYGLVDRFLGIPYAKPPIYNLRFRRPQPIPAYTRSFSATSYGHACPQQWVQLPNITGLPLPQEIADDVFNTAFSAVFPDGEDCLTVNVVRPAHTKPTSKLPVLVWIFGGGFEFGAPNPYDGRAIVLRSMTMLEPIIFVSINYRVSGKNAASYVNHEMAKIWLAFGFLGGKEVKKEGVGNLGLHDQRQALRWVQKYISAFGGDPKQVIIWGESAGAISVSLQMITNNGNTEGLFHGAIMQSGAPIPVGGIEKGQHYYDAIVKNTGCNKYKNTLQCLRKVPYEKLKAAANKSPSLFSYQSLNLPWVPRTDGVFLTDNPQRLVMQGKVARIPYITGNCDDEGSLFAYSARNVTTDAQFEEYFMNVFLPGISQSQVKQVANLYPTRSTERSPFDFCVFNALNSQSPRLATVQGDGVFQAPRRWLLEHTSKKQDTWVYLSKRFKDVPCFGSMHASDLVNTFFYGQELQDYIIRFANKLNPSDTGLLSFGHQWPKYTPDNPIQLIFHDGLIPYTTTGKDTYRKKQMDFLNQLTLKVPV